MGFVRRTATSRRDYVEIWKHVADDDPTAADELLRTFDQKVTLLSDFPHMGRARPEIRPRLRSFTVGKYLLFYRPLRDGIELLRVIHGARNLREVFRRRRS
jgi:toxin ParE1/3/4